MAEEQVSKVYFVRSPDGSIKIGVSGDVRKRVQSLNNTVPGGVELLCTLMGSRHLEAYLHRRFRESRIGGEWFSPVEGLLALIEDIKDRGQAAMPSGFEEPLGDDLRHRVVEVANDVVDFINICAGSDDVAVPSITLEALQLVSGIPQKRLAAYLTREKEVLAADYECLRLLATKKARCAEDYFIVANAFSRDVQTMSEPLTVAMSRVWPPKAPEPDDYGPDWAKARDRASGGGAAGLKTEGGA